MLRYFLPFLLSIFLVEAKGKHFPSYVKKCPHQSPDYFECAMNRTNEVLPTILKGVPSLGILPVDPLTIPHFQVKLPGLEMNFTDAVVKGTGNFLMTNFSLHPNETPYVCRMSFANKLIQMKFDFGAIGKIGAYSLQDEGHGTIEIINATYSFKYEYFFIKKDDMDYIKSQNFIFQVEPEKMQFKFDGLFKGHKEQGENFNKFLNENWRELRNEFNPVVIEIFRVVKEKVFLPIITEIPVQNWVPDWVES